MLYFFVEILSEITINIYLLTIFGTIYLLTILFRTIYLLTILFETIYLLTLF